MVDKDRRIKTLEDLVFKLESNIDSKDREIYRLKIKLDKAENELRPKTYHDYDPIIDGYGGGMM